MSVSSKTDSLLHSLRNTSVLTKGKALEETVGMIASAILQGEPLGTRTFHIEPNQSVFPNGVRSEISPERLQTFSFVLTKVWGRICFTSARRPPADELALLRNQR